MKSPTAPTKEQLEELYGSPASLRLPVNLKKRITEDALLRGQTFSSYSADLLANAVHKGQEKDAEISLLIRERNNLQQQVQKQQEQFNWLSGGDNLILQKLKQNREILRRFSPAIETSRAQLAREGFDFHYATHHLAIDGRNCIAVFDFCYRVEASQIHILKLDQ